MGTSVNLPETTYGKVENGKAEGSDWANKLKTHDENTALGKEDFMKLLVTQMQYQDPLNPQTDTQFIAQLAQFSSLEQMQNLNATNIESQAFSMVGKQVAIKIEDSSGKISYDQGTVDFVIKSGGKIYLHVNDKNYTMDQVESVISDYFVAQLNGPKVEKQEFVYDFDNPEDIKIKVDFGNEPYHANQVGVVISGKGSIDSKYLSEEDGVLTIKKEAFEGMKSGDYKLGLVFDDPYLTTVTDKVTLTIKNAKETPDGGDPDDGDPTDPDGGDNTPPTT